MNDRSKEYSDLMQGLVGPHVSPVRARALIAGYAHRLAERQREEASSIHLVETREANGMFRVADMIDPEVKP